MGAIQVLPSGLFSDKLKVTILGSPKDRLYQTWKNFSPKRSWVTPKNSIENLREGVLQRVLYRKNDGGEFVPPPTVDSVILNECLSKFSSAFKAVKPSTSRKTYSRVISVYNGRKLKRYQNARLSLLLKGMRDTYANVMAFIKYEKSKEDFVPRVISTRRPQYHLELLTYLQGLEKSIFKCIDKIFESPTVMKGKNSVERGKIISAKWAKFNKPVAFSFDLARMDQHVSLEALQWEHEIYSSCFSGIDKKKLCKLLNKQLRNKVWGKASNGFLKYTTRGVRMSGDVNTGLGNTLIVCAMIYCYCKIYKIDKGEVIDDGDDGAIIIEETDIPKIFELKTFALKCGFVMKLERPVFILEKLIFCQAQPVIGSDGQYRMVRHPHKSCSKDVICLEPRKTNLGRNDWLHAIGSSGMSMSGGIPIFQEYYSSILRGTKTPKKNPQVLENGLYWLSRRMNDVYTKITTMTRVSFWKAFDIDPIRQIILENSYKFLKIDLNTTDHGGVNSYW